MKIEIELQPFTVPNFVMENGKIGKRQEGMRPISSHPLSELSEQTLSEMCDEFRVGVFSKAGKPDPRTTPQAQRDNPDTRR